MVSMRTGRMPLEAELCVWRPPGHAGGQISGAAAAPAWPTSTQSSSSRCLRRLTAGPAAFPVLRRI